MTDLEGVTRIDFSNNMASLIHGHACPEIIHAVTEQMTRGTAFMMGTEIEVRYAEHLCSRNRSFEKMRFMNSGTEAIMVALKAARAFTGRPKIAKAEGAYHGVYDYAEVSQGSTPATWGGIDHPRSVPLVHGTPESALKDVVVFPFNDTERTLAILDEHARDLACVLIDLMPHRVGLCPADVEFVTALREWSERHGVLLVFDEVITFRAEHSGLQARYGVTPDMTALGKIIGGGFAVGAVAGLARILDLSTPDRDQRVTHAGTFNGNPMMAAAGRATMEVLTPRAFEQLADLGEYTRAGLSAAARGLPLQVTGAGSLFKVTATPRVLHDYRDAATADRRWEALCSLALLNEGFVLTPSMSGCVSTVTTRAQVDAMLEAFRDIVAA